MISTEDLVLNIKKASLQLPAKVKYVSLDGKYVFGSYLSSFDHISKDIPEPDSAGVFTVYPESIVLINKPIDEVYSSPILEDRQKISEIFGLPLTVE